MENAAQEISCPVCTKKQGTHLWEKGEYRIARCAFCRTLFVENPPQDTSFVYDEGYFFGGEGRGGYVSYDAEKDAMRSTFERALTIIEKHQKKGELFDIGAATGYFLDVARTRGWKVRGIDISAAAAAEALKKGIEVKAGTLGTVSYSPDSFDAVTMFDVIEHVADPSQMLKQTSEILKAGGVVFGSTPDSLSVNARISGKGWHMLFPPEHLVLMNAKSLRILFEREGYEVLWMGRLTKWFTPQYILQTASRWLGWKFLGSLAAVVQKTPLSRLPIPLDLRDNLFFLARKK